MCELVRCVFEKVYQPSIRLLVTNVLKTIPRRPKSSPDILGEVLLEFIQTADRYNVHTGGEVTAYLAANAVGAVKRALAKEKFIRVPHHALARARANGTEQALYALQPESLDAWMAWHEMEEAEELPMQPVTSPNAAPERDPALRAQVETWLSYLSAHEQTIVRLHYGLCEEDERPYGIAEIARLCGVKPGTMQARLRATLIRLKALAQGTATITEKQGQLRVTHISKFKPPVLTHEQEITLMQRATRLHEAGIPVTARRLAQESGLSKARAEVFLPAHRDRFPANAAARALHQERLAHVAAVYAEHVALGGAHHLWRPVGETRPDQ
jgi:DNA-directed RNA polymerase specialized sigma24 family protein